MGKFTIVNGPSARKLMVALFKRRTVPFALRAPESDDTVVYQLSVRGVTADDRSDGWLIRGFHVKPDESKIVGFRGYYRGNTRTGWLKNVWTMEQ